MENLAQYWLAFASIEQLGSVFIKRVVENFGSPKSAWCAAPDELYRVENLTKKQIDYFIKARKVVEPEERLAFILNKGIKFINYTDVEYPLLLKQISNPPMTLFYKGDLSRCNFDRTLSVVGSRKASENAKSNLSKILSGLANTDVCIVSGLAAGIDTCAHKAAIQNNLTTIGVIGSGFDFVYPSSNKELYRQIEEKYGVIFSEYWPTEQPISWHFPHRNRIVSGLSRGTLVAEAALKSGAIITANLCLEQNRELMCMPGQISNPNTEGIYKLLKAGAALVTTTQDILDTMGWEFKNTAAETEEKNDCGLEGLQKEIYDMVSRQDTDLDGLLARINVEYAELITVLTGMELDGYIKQTDGGKYSLP